MTAATAHALREPRRRHATWSLALVVLLLVTGELVAWPRESGAATKAARRVAVWLTTPDGRALLARQPDLSAGRSAAPLVIQVDPTRRHQRITGFGASLTQSSATLLAGLPAAQRDALLAELFSAEAGIGLSLLRQPAGASDFATSHYSYDDVPAGSSDPGLAAFSLGPDGRDVLPLLAAARRVNPALSVMLSPWSAPGWMKTSGSLVGGTLRPDAQGSYAAYLVRTLREYADRGVPVQLLALQNEASYSPPDYPGMTLSPQQAAELVGRHLGPALAAADLPVQLLGIDDNWSRSGDAAALYADPVAGGYVSGAGFHCYDGEVSAQAALRAAHPDKDVFLTECSGGEWSPSFASNLWWDTEKLLIEGTRAGAAGITLWNLALDPAGGPRTGGCSNCRGVVTIDPGTGRVTRNVEYYVLGHVSKFVRPGAYRIESTDLGPGSIRTTAFRNPDGSTVLLAMNAGTASRSFSVAVGGSPVTYTLAPGAVATLRW